MKCNFQIMPNRMERDFLNIKRNMKRRHCRYYGQVGMYLERMSQNSKRSLHSI